MAARGSIWIGGNRKREEAHDGERLLRTASAAGRATGRACGGRDVWNGVRQRRGSGQACGGVGCWKGGGVQRGVSVVFFLSTGRASLDVRFDYDEHLIIGRFWLVR